MLRWWTINCHILPAFIQINHSLINNLLGSFYSYFLSINLPTYILIYDSSDIFSTKEEETCIYWSISADKRDVSADVKRW